MRLCPYGDITLIALWYEWYYTHQQLDQSEGASSILRPLFYVLSTAEQWREMKQKPTKPPMPQKRQKGNRVSFLMNIIIISLTNAQWRIWFTNPWFSYLRLYREYKFISASLTCLHLSHFDKFVLQITVENIGALGGGGGGSHGALASDIPQKLARIFF